MENYLYKINNLEEVINEEYNENKRTFKESKDGLLESIKDDLENNKKKSYFSMVIRFGKETREDEDSAVAYACIRMLAFKRFIQEELGYENVTNDVIVFDNYTVYVRTIIHHE